MTEEMTSNSITFSYVEVARAVAMMIIVIFIGTIGNTLVILILCLKKSSIGSRWNRQRRQLEIRESGSVGDVYYNDFQDKTLDFFILVLAVSDLLVCVLIIPSTIVMELREFRINIDFLCKLYYVLFVTNTTFSSLLISAVALDRYLFICHSLKRYLTLLRAKILVSALALFSLAVGMGAGSVVGVRLPPASLNATADDVDFICEEIEYTQGITEYQRIFSVVTKRVNHACYLVCIIVVFVLYSFVFFAIVSTQSRNAKIATQMQEQPQQQQQQERANSNGDIIAGKPSTRSSRPSRQRVMILSAKIVQRTQFTLQNLRSAIMLFVIAMVYILTFVPALIFANGWAPHNLVLLYLYYLNSAANPCIYAAFTPSFRQMVVLVIKNYLHCSCCRPGSLKTVASITTNGHRGTNLPVNRPSRCPIGRRLNHYRRHRAKEHIYPFVTREQRMAALANSGLEPPNHDSQLSPTPIPDTK